MTDPACSFVFEATEFAEGFAAAADFSAAQTLREVQRNPAANLDVVRVRGRELAP